MGNCRSELRAAIRSNDVTTVRRILEAAGNGSGDLINDDMTSNCLFGCLIRSDLNPLHTTVTFKQYVITEVLLQYGADPEATTYWNQTPLHLAARFDNVQAATLLINEYKANIESRTINGDTALHVAAMSKAGCDSQSIKDGVMSLLIDKARETDLIVIQNNDGDSALHKACSVDNVAKVTFLLQNGADLNQRNHTGLTALDVAKPNAKAAVEKFKEQ